uniref:Uncharacterized protein n=1 Tax=Arundo donax TaxID=35708 RepID=A0A0A9ALS5_ARUDO
MHLPFQYAAQECQPINTKNTNMKRSKNSVAI